MPTERAGYVSQMFGRIAGRYDRMNTLMTLGLDAGWRRLAVRAAEPPANGLALDVGTGTGKLALALAQRMPAGHVIGLDFSEPMMQQGRDVNPSRPPGGRLSFVGGDAQALPFPDSTFDCVVSAFTVRNLGDPRAGFREMARVVRPGGPVVCLEITRLESPRMRWLFGLYFQRLVPVVGRIVSGDPTAYKYLPTSVEAFMTASELADEMRATGLHDVKYRGLGAGTVALLMGVRAMS